jgi:hypothetical protein
LTRSDGGSVCGGIGSSTAPFVAPDSAACFRSRASWMRRSSELSRVTTLRSFVRFANSVYILS